ncbi:MAG: hypothetical protein DI587_07465 [Variovorax paradoxus]|nr:MAG: hypothetical protein DI583_07465 [Variovorax paradoxus]PZQ13363.1 MAG: hypothetical protein DI587_07465 [Variovorax paradoxus]
MPSAWPDRRRAAPSPGSRTPPSRPRSRARGRCPRCAPAAATSDRRRRRPPRRCARRRRRCRRRGPRRPA